MIHVQSFRDADGQVVDSFKLTLFLSDIIYKEYAARLLGCEEVVIEMTAGQLCDIYEGAVRRQIKENEMKSACAVASREAAAREEDVHAEASHEEHPPVALKSCLPFYPKSSYKTDVEARRGIL
jgi:hypothetical protein